MYRRQFCEKLRGIIEYLQAIPLALILYGILFLRLTIRGFLIIWIIGKYFTPTAATKMSEMKFINFNIQIMIYYLFAMFKTDAGADFAFIWKAIL